MDDVADAVLVEDPLHDRRKIGDVAVLERDLGELVRDA